MEEHVWEFVRSFAGAMLGRLIGDRLARALGRRGDDKATHQ
jgi:hypothetical protein